jgi:hypothetical protein
VVALGSRRPKVYIEHLGNCVSEGKGKRLERKMFRRGCNPVHIDAHNNGRAVAASTGVLVAVVVFLFGVIFFVIMRATIARMAAFFIVVMARAVVFIDKNFEFARVSAATLMHSDACCNNEIQQNQKCRYELFNHKSQ